MMKKSIVKDQKKDRHSDKDSKKRKLIDADIPKLDVFNYDILINTEKDICAMCKNDHIFGLNMKNIMNQLNNYEDDDHYDPKNIKDADDVWVSRYSLQHKTRRIFIHLHCALASPQVYVEENLWYNLHKEVYRSSSLICRDCNDRGATIGCYIRNCSYVLHVPCAMKKGFKVTTYNRTFICPEHDQIHIKQAKLKDKLVEHDVTKGKELLPIHIIDLSNNHDTTSSSSSSSSSVVAAAASQSSSVEAFDHHNQSNTNISNNNSGNKKHPQQQYLSLPKGFNYISTNLDSNDCIVNRRKVDLTDCCDCVNGLCVDIMKCACIQSGRNYNYDGSLIPGTSTTSNHRIVECNWKCACSMRRCSNRVVEKGMNTYRLEIFLINDGDSKRKRKRKKKMIIRKNHINDSSSSSKIDDDDDGNGDADIQEDSIWGVRTLDFIPQNAFICEVVGQYVYGSSKPLPPTPSLHESVAVESLLSSSSSSSSSSSPSSYSSSSSRIYDILPQKSSSSITDILLSTSSSYTTSDGDNNNDDDDLKSSNRIIPVNMWEKNTIYPVNEWVLNQMNKDPTIDDDLNTNSSFSSLIDKEYDAIKSYLNGQLCIDSRYFGNVSSFIRRRNYIKTTTAGPSSSFSSSSSTFIMMRINNDKISSPSMVYRKLVYTNRRTGHNQPKLALFAAKDIAPYTEIVI